MTINAPASYASGSSHTINVTVSDPTQRRWGFELSARTASGQQAGTLSPSDGTTQIKLLSGIQYIEHTNAPFTSVGAGFTFTFNWQAPDTSTGPVTFYAAGNAANGNGTADSGDHIYTSSWEVQPEAEPPPPPPPPTGPFVSENGVTNVAGSAPGANALSVGTIADIAGTNLNDGSSNALPMFGSDGKLLTTFGGASVTFNGIPAPLLSSFPTRLTVQVPEGLAPAGSAAVQVTVNGQTSEPRTVPIAPSSPGIFTLTQDGAGQGVVLISDTAFFAAPPNSIPGALARAVNQEEFITIYAVGLGEVSNPPGTGSPASDNPLSTTFQMPEVTIGGVPATNVSFSGLVPGFVGLFKVRVQVPAGAPPGDAVPLLLTIGGVQSNTVTIAVGSAPPSSSDPVPAITALSPSTFTLDLDQQTVSIVGSGFTSSCTVTVNGVPKTPAYVSDTQLSILVTYDDFPSEGDYPVVVTNSQGGASNSFNLHVSQPLPDGSDNY